MLSILVVQLKIKWLLKKPTHDYIIEAKAVYIQQSFGRYKGNLCCIIKVCQYNKRDWYKSIHFTTMVDALKFGTFCLP